MEVSVGHGGSRELSKGTGELPPLDGAISARMGEALEKLDARDPDFKSTRDDERDAQRSKHWGRTCKQIDGYLQTVARVLIAAHQVGLENGSVGGGRATQPWIAETEGKLGRLVFRLDGDTVEVVAGDKLMANGIIDDVTYDWVQKVVVKWVILAAEGQLPIP